MSTYDPQKIEPKWQKWWDEHRSFAVTKDDFSKPKYYALDMFPYPSGAGLHVGHPLGYFATDIVTRYKRLKGFNVLHPMGFDAFGLPAEQYAVSKRVHPAITTAENTQRYREQLELMGLHYDPDAWFRTSDPNYYRWTQWIFTKLFTHWYDTQQKKARPISELIAEFEANGNTRVLAAHDHPKLFTAERWKTFSPQEKDEALMYYRLAYSSFATVNWCPALGTVLANDEVKDGRSERGNHPVERRDMQQWMLRITAYADRLLEGLDELDWSDSLKAMQRNWIGRSTGAILKYEIQDTRHAFEVYTTRPDTIFGNTFMVLAPEHPLVAEITTPGCRKAVEAYAERAQNRSERERIADTSKTGEFTGAYALHPFSGKPLPIWISDYVLYGYGTGAIMAVPAHDQRDYEFAKEFGLPVTEVIRGGDISVEAFDNINGRVVNSQFLNGLKAHVAIDRAIERAEEMGIGYAETQYRLRDAIWSRQRYWGEPTPVVYRDGVAEALPPEDLPLELPHLDDFDPSPSGEPPLSRTPEAWQQPEPGVQRDLNTMPGAAGSSWYFFRYLDPQNDEAFVDFERAKYWLPVDLYMGGAEHAVGHLLYSRLWTKFLFDLGYSPVEEPFKRLVNQGMIQGVSEKMYRISMPANHVFGKNLKMRWESHGLGKDYNIFVSAELVDEYPSEAGYGKIPVLIDHVREYGLTSPSYLDLESLEGIIEWRPEYEHAVFVTAGGYYQNGRFHSFENGGVDRFFTSTEVEKMSKSKFNVVNPDEVIAEYGADTFRMFEMFLGPIEHGKPWDTQSITGVFRFLRRTWDLYVGENDSWRVTDEEPNREELRELHKLIKKVDEDVERLSFNTSVAAFMDFVNNFLSKRKTQKRALLEPLAILLSPYAPHLCEELWQRLGHDTTILEADFPVLNETYLVEDEVEYPVQVNGKVRTKITVPVDADRQAVEKVALENERVREFMEGKPPRKVIVVPGRIVNVVV